MSELPLGWVTAEIGQVCSLKNGRAFKPSEWSSKGIPIVRIQNLNNADGGFNHFAGAYESRYHLKGGELLFAWSGTPGTSFGAHIWRGHEAVLNQHIFRVDFDEQSIDKRFFRHAINQKLDEIIGVAHGGVGLRHVTKGVFERTEICVPPLAEQKRIADKLEAVLGRVDACRARLDRVPNFVKRFRQSVLVAATAGQLTDDWREGRALEDWRSLKVSDVGSVQLGRQRAPKYHQGENMRPYLRVQNVYEARLDLSDVMEMEFSEADYKRYKLSYGDILLNEGQSPQYLGRPAMFRDDLPGACFTNSLIRFRAKLDILDREYALLVFRHYMRSGRFAKEGSITTNIAHLSAGKFANIEFPLPPLREQEEIVRRVEALFAFADRIEAHMTEARAKVERLTPATLAKAFRGELVSQEPADEPAAATLQRLRTPRELFDPFAYLFQFIPALIRASEGALPFARTLEGCALLRVPRDLVRLLEPIGGAPARQHFARFAQPLNDGSFEPVLRKLIDAGAIMHDPRANHRLRLVDTKAPPIAPLIAEDARHVASVLALVPAEALKDLTPRHTRKLCPKPAAAILAG